MIKSYFFVLCIDYFKHFETIMDINDQTEEPNLIQVSVTADMSKQEVVEEILRKVSLDQVPEEKKEEFKVRKLKTDCKFTFM